MEKWLTAWKLVLFIAMSYSSVAWAEVPILRQGALSRSIIVDDIEFQLYKDRDDSNLIYLMPRSLKVARDEHGVPKVSVVLLREAVEGNRQSNGYGYVLMSVTIGPQMTQELYGRVREQIGKAYPDLSNVSLAPIAFKAGTAKLAFQVLNSGGARTEIPINAPITLGAEIPVMIPITKEHGAMIHQVSAQGKDKNDSRDLGISISYEAKVAFELETTVVTVEAEKSEMYKYFQEKKRVGGGFWIFNYSSERNTIRENFEKSGHLKGKIRFGDKELTDSVGGAEYLKGLLSEAKNQAVDFMMNIEVARTPGEAPMDGYKERAGRTTIFGPNYFWSYSSYLSFGNSTVDIERRASGKYMEEYRFEGTADLPVALVAETVTLPKDFVSVVSLDNAFYVRELVAAQSLDIADIWGNTSGRISHATLEVVVGESTDSESPQILKFGFDRLNPTTKSIGFWRNSRFKRDSSGLIEPELAKIRVRGEIATTQGGKISIPLKPGDYQTLTRSSSPFEPQVVRLADFFGIATVDASLLFDSIEEGCNPVLRVTVDRPGRKVETLSLRRTDSKAYIPFVVRDDGSSGLEPGSSMRVELIGRSRSGSSSAVPLDNSPDVIPTLSDLPAGWQKVCAN